MLSAHSAEKDALGKAAAETSAAAAAAASSSPDRSGFGELRADLVCPRPSDRVVHVPYVNPGTGPSNNDANTVGRAPRYSTRASSRNGSDTRRVPSTLRTMSGRIAVEARIQIFDIGGRVCVRACVRAFGCTTVCCLQSGGTAGPGRPPAPGLPVVTTQGYVCVLACTSLIRSGQVIKSGQVRSSQIVAHAFATAHAIYSH